MTVIITETLTESLVLQCSYEKFIVNNLNKEVDWFITLTFTFKIWKHIDAFKNRKRPGLHTVSNKTLKCFSKWHCAYIVTNLNTIFRFKNGKSQCYNHKKLQTLLKLSVSIFSEIDQTSDYKITDRLRVVPKIQFEFLLHLLHHQPLHFSKMVRVTKFFLKTFQLLK